MRPLYLQLCRFASQRDRSRFGVHCLAVPPRGSCGVSFATPKVLHGALFAASARCGSAACTRAIPIPSTALRTERVLAAIRRWSFLSACVSHRALAKNCTALHCTALYCTALHCTALHCTALHCTALLCTALHCTALLCIAVRRRNVLLALSACITLSNARCPVPTRGFAQCTIVLPQLRLSAEQLWSSPRDLNDLPGCVGDDRTLGTAELTPTPRSAAAPISPFAFC